LTELSDFGLTIAFFGLHGSKVKGRTRIQKEICILKHDRDIPIKLEFKPYFYGPYSRKLSNIVDTLVAVGVLKQTIVRVGIKIYRYDYTLTQHGKKWFASIKETLETNCPEILSKLKSNIDQFQKMSIPNITSLAKECSGMFSIET